MKQFSDISKVLSEKRSHADMNPKESVVKYLMDNLNNNNTYIHFSNIEKVGIKPDSKWATPVGVYGWQLNYYKKKLIQNVEDAKKTAADWFKEYKLTPNSTPAEVEAKGIDWKNFWTAVEMLDGTSGIKLKRVFPFMGEAKYMHVIEAKSGIKWLRVGDTRTSVEETKAGLKVIEMFLMKTDTKKVENMTGFDIDSFLEQDTHGTVVVFRKVELPVLQKWFGLSKKEILEALDKLEENPNSQEAKLWLVRKVMVQAIMITEGAQTGNAEFLFRLVSHIAMNLAKNREGSAILKTSMFRAMGYDAIRDDGTGSFYSSTEPAQVVFLHPNAYSVRKTLNNDSVDREKRKALFGFDSQTKKDSFEKAKYESDW